MKKKSHFRIMFLTAMLTFGALAFTKMSVYKTHYKHKVDHCQKVQENTNQSTLQAK